MSLTKNWLKCGLAGLLAALVAGIPATAIADELRPDPSPALPLVYRSIPVELAVLRGAALPARPADASGLAQSAGTARPTATTGGGDKRVATTDAAIGGRAKPRTHLVRRGETLAGLGRRYQVSPWLLGELNGIRNAASLRAGLVLRVPPPHAYLVRPGDTYFSLGNRFKRSPSALRRWNEGRPLQAGALITVPPAKGR